MQHMPALEMRLKDFGEQLIGHLALHQAEIQQYVQAGVERGLAPLVAMLHGSPTEEGTDGRDVAHR